MCNSKNIVFKDIIYKIIDNKIDKINVNKDIFKNISYENFNIFLNALKLNKSIKTLKFYKWNLSQDYYNKIFNFMQNNKTITKFKIDDFKIIFNYEINELIDYFNKIKQINVINNCSEDKIINLQNNINDIIQDLINKNNIPICNLIKNNNLKSLTLQLNYTSNKILIDNVLVNVFKQNKNITNLNLCDSYNLIHFTDLLNYNENIIKFNFQLSLTGINLTDFENFCKCIEYNKNLKHLTIHSVIKKSIPIDKINYIKETLFNALINNKYIETISFRGKSFILENTPIDWNLIVKLLQNNNRIKELYFKYFKLEHTKGVNHILEYLQTNNSLKKLTIKSNDFNTKILALMIKNNKTLEHLDLSYSKFSNIDLMLEFLKTNTTLKYLNLKNITVKDEYFNKNIISEVLKYNKNIKIDY